MPTLLHRTQLPDHDSGHVATFGIRDDAHFDRVLTAVVIAFVHRRLASGAAGGAARKIQQVAVAVLAKAQALIEAMRSLALDVA